MRKKILSFALALCMVLTLMPVTAWAEPAAVVNERDWSVYSGSLSKENLSRGEARFYDRLDKMYVKYLSSSALDGVKDTSDIPVWYITEAVKYSDLGLTKDQAGKVYGWFLHNTPQCYFLQGDYLWSNDALFPRMYDFAADGKNRAEITNALFDTLDAWIQAVADNASATWQKELLANNLICEAVDYNHDALLDGHEEEHALCQSIYSAVILRSTVCAGYAKTFCAMMNALGVENVVAVSKNHGWNIVRLDDGNYYVVDVTTNDMNSFNYFLNAGETTIRTLAKNGGEAFISRKEFAAWIPAISKDDYVPAGNVQADTDNTGGMDAAPDYADDAASCIHERRFFRNGA